MTPKQTATIKRMKRAGWQVLTKGVCSALLVLRPAGPYDMSQYAYVKADGSVIYKRKG